MTFIIMVYVKILLSSLKLEVILSSLMLKLIAL